MDQNNLYNELMETDNSKLRNGFIQLLSLPDEPLKIIVNFFSKFIKNKILPTDISYDLKKYDFKLNRLSKFNKYNLAYYIFFRTARKRKI